MAYPVLVTPPLAPVVSLADLKAHLREDSNDHNTQIEGFQNAAVAYLDGWRGVLGRAINSQVWREDFTGFGDLRLAMPDVTAFTVTYRNSSGSMVSASGAVLSGDECGPYVTVDGPSTDLVRVQYTCGLPVELLPIAQSIVKLLVGHWYDNRSTVNIGNIKSELPLTAPALISHIRWRRV